MSRSSKLGYQNIKTEVAQRNLVVTGKIPVIIDGSPLWAKGVQNMDQVHAELPESGFPKGSRGVEAQGYVFHHQILSLCSPIFAQNMICSRV